ncbi:hypothetical protein GCM10011529_25920 [Polymorphobacter glacialis]|uniref:DUF306 domain-containing protein n=1 Tax=Sandarakinorhabdus glacialis TaxID=1614636 RepID=A0A916ZXQ9_9SPHN|nr:META domain-containing protein [Polymorphobacter glacialis]GGE18228.1 hypothetical protein GCM10011529_25920 [Polymorphobacter glacialis]
MKTVLIAGVFLLAGCTATGEAAKVAGQALGGSLEGGPWLITSVNGAAVDPSVRADITFEPGDQNTSAVYGTGGCNRFRGGWKQNGTVIDLGPLAGTRMMCEDKKMKVEGPVMSGLDAATAVVFAADGTATLTAPDGGVVSIRREKK